MIPDGYLDVFQELVNIGVGRAAGLLNQMAHVHIKLSVPEILLLSPMELSQKKIFSSLPEHVVAMELSFSGGFCGRTILGFPALSAMELVRHVTGDDIPASDMDGMRTGTLMEIGNVILSAILGTIGNLMHEHLEYDPPRFYEGSPEMILESVGGSDFTVIFIRTCFELEKLMITGDILIFFRVGSTEALLAVLDRIMNDET